MARVKRCGPKKPAPTDARERPRRPLLPPAFLDVTERRLKEGKYSSRAIQWYLSQLTKRDVADKDTRGFTELEKILRHGARQPAEPGESQWVAKKSLGRGSYGEVVLWQREIGPEKRVESVACKDAKWDDWFMDYSTEAHLTRRLNAAGCDNVVGVLDWKSLPTKLVTRILYEYCPHGSLQRLMRFYSTQCRVTIPEPFLWHIFHSIAIAICYNDRGTTEPEYDQNWLTIVHRDLKPENILLSDPEPNNKELYPHLKLGDYGLAYSIPKKPDLKEMIQRLKRTHWSGGTRGYVAPEVNDKIRSDPNQAPYAIASPRSDVFSLGCVMLAFLRIPVSRYNKSAWELLELSMGYAFEYYPYSKALVSLCRECINPDAEKRPSAFSLFQRTRDYANTSYEAVSIASETQLTQPGSAFEGQVLWDQDMQNRYLNNDVFRDAYTAKNDWFASHRPELRRLYMAAKAPGREAIPEPGKVAMGNGLGPFLGLAGLEGLLATVPREDWVTELKVYNTQGERLVPKDQRQLLRFKGQDQLGVESPDENWKEPAKEKQPDVGTKPPGERQPLGEMPPPPGRARLRQMPPAPGRPRLKRMPPSWGRALPMEEPPLRGNQAMEDAIPVNPVVAAIRQQRRAARDADPAERQLREARETREASAVARDAGNARDLGDVRDRNARNAARFLNMGGGFQGPPEDPGASRDRAVAPLPRAQAAAVAGPQPVAPVPRAQVADQQPVAPEYETPPEHRGPYW